MTLNTTPSLTSYAAPQHDHVPSHARPVMRSVFIDEYGGTEVIKKSSVTPRPTPRPGEVLVRVVCAGINFMDIHTRQGKYATSETYPVRLPCTLGMEGAGDVVEVGEGVDHLAVGNRVAWCIAWGSYADYVSIPAALAARLPAGIAYDVAAASMFQGCTAHYLVHDVSQLRAGDSCLVLAASGSIGQLLVQMAKRLGVTVFATASTPEKCEVARALGADEVIMYGDGNFARDVRAATNGRGVDVVFDSVGRTTLRESLRAARKRGLVINYGSVSGPVSDLDPIELGEAGSLFLTRPRLADHMADAVTVQRRADDVFQAILKGELKVQISGSSRLEDVEEIHARIEGREQIGKQIIRIRDEEGVDTAGLSHA